MDLHIRPERPGDAVAVAEVVRQAYAAVPYSDHREHRMVERLRTSPDYVPELSLLAEVDGQAAGHVLLTRIEVVDGAHRTPGLALAPLSVAPAFQGRGVGGRLVREAHARAARLGWRFIVLVGLSGYYPRFGYQPLDAWPIALPFETARAERMILPLCADALEGVHGQVQYAPEWLDH